MQAFKAKVIKTTADKPTLIAQLPPGQALELQSVFFKSKNPNAFLFLVDKDGDEVMYPIPGQIDPHPVLLSCSLMINGPLYYVDTKGEHELIVTGRIVNIDRRTPSTFA
jgi:hypothetical protein